MNAPHDDRPGLSRDEREFVERLAEGYAPPALTAARRNAFDRELERRLARPRRWLAAAWLPAAAAAALAVAWLAGGRPEATGPRPSPERTAPILSERDWESEIFWGDAAGGAQLDERELLPEEYLAIASVLDG
jgi:hypothetical protein